MTQFSDSNRTLVRYIFETQWGSAPASGATRALRFTQHSIEQKKTTTKTTEIRADRMVGAIVETAAMTDGSISFELSAGSQDDFFQAFMAGTWSRPMTFDKFQGSSVAWTSGTTFTVSGQGDVAAYFTAGRRLKTQGFVNPVNNAFWSIVSAATASGVTTVTVSGTNVPVAETGGPKARVLDANDIVVLNNGTIRAGTTNNAFDSNGTNAFASAIAAGQLVVGQVIHVEGLGYAAGSVTFTAAASAGDTVLVTDGTSGTVTFMAGTDFAVGASATTTATALAAAINAARVNGKAVSGSLVYPQVTATSAAGVVTIVNLMTSAGAITKGVDAGGVQTVVTFSTPAANQRGIFTIAALSNDVITVTGPVSANTNSTNVPVTIRGSMLRNPGNYVAITPQSFAIETGYTDVGQYFTTFGQRVGDFDLEISAGQLVKGTFNLMGGKTTVAQATTFGSAPYTVLGTTITDNLNATTNVGALVKNGAPLSTAIKDIKLSGKSSLRNQEAVSSKYPVGIGTGQFTLTGTIAAYFATIDLWNNFNNFDTISIAFNIQDADGNYYNFTVPAAKVTGDPIVPKGIDQDVMEELAIEAFRDPVTACMLQIDRFSSVRPIGG